MIAVTLTSNPHADFVLCEMDAHGRVVPRDRQTHFISQIPIDCRSEDRTIDLGFYVRGRIPIAEVERLPREKQNVSVAVAVAKSAFAFLPACRSWPLYGSTEIRVTEPLVESPEYPPPLTTEAAILPEAADAMRAESKLRCETAALFEKAKDFLYRELRYPHGSESRLRSAGRFFEGCRRGRAADYGSLMDDNEHKDLMPYLEHVLGLKNPRHPNVRAADKAQTLIFLTHFPRYWERRIPQPRDYGAEWLLE